MSSQVRKVLNTTAQNAVSTPTGRSWNNRLVYLGLGLGIAVASFVLYRIWNRKGPDSSPDSMQGRTTPQSYNPLRSILGAVTPSAIVDTRSQLEKDLSANFLKVFGIQCEFNLQSPNHYRQQITRISRQWCAYYPPFFEKIYDELQNILDKNEPNLDPKAFELANDLLRCLIAGSTYKGCQWICYQIPLPEWEEFPRWAGCPSLEELESTAAQLVADLFKYPEEVKKIKKLEFRDNLNVVPEFFSQLTSLEVLYFGNDGGIAFLPEFLSNLTHLKRIDVSDNRLEILPLSLAQLPATCTITARTSLSYSLLQRSNPKPHLSPEAIEAFNAEVQKVRKQDPSRGPQLIA